MSTSSQAPSWVAIVIAAMGPIFGPASLILFAAFVGAFLELGRTDVQSRLEGAIHVLVSVGVSMVLTGSCLWAITKFTSIPGDVALMPVAFALSAGRQFILDAVKKLIDAASDFLSSFFKRG